MSAVPTCWEFYKYIKVSSRFCATCWQSSIWMGAVSLLDDDACLQWGRCSGRKRKCLQQMHRIFFFLKQSRFLLMLFFPLFFFFIFFFLSPIRSHNQYLLANHFCLFYFYCALLTFLSFLFQRCNVRDKVERLEAYETKQLRIDYSAHVKPALWVFVVVFLFCFLTPVARRPMSPFFFFFNFLWFIGLIHQFFLFCVWGFSFKLL